MLLKYFLASLLPIFVIPFLRFDNKYPADQKEEKWIWLFLLFPKTFLLIVMTYYLNTLEPAVFSLQPFSSFFWVGFNKVNSQLLLINTVTMLVFIVGMNSVRPLFISYLVVSFFLIIDVKYGAFLLPFLIIFNPLLMRAMGFFSLSYFPQGLSNVLFAFFVLWLADLSTFIILLCGLEGVIFSNLLVLITLLVVPVVLKIVLIDFLMERRNTHFLSFVFVSLFFSLFLLYRYDLSILSAQEYKTFNVFSVIFGGGIIFFSTMFRGCFAPIKIFSLLLLPPLVIPFSVAYPYFSFGSLGIYTLIYRQFGANIKPRETKKLDSVFLLLNLEFFRKMKAQVASYLLGGIYILVFCLRIPQMLLTLTEIPLRSFHNGNIQRSFILFLIFSLIYFS